MGGRGGASNLAKSKYAPFTGSQENYEDILRAIQKSGLDYFGIRVSEEERGIGAFFNLSEDMENGGKLDGTSTIGLVGTYGGVDSYSDTEDVKEAVQKALNIAKSYSGKHISIVGGSEYSYGSDEGEWVINNDDYRRKGAKIIYKIK